MPSLQPSCLPRFTTPSKRPKDKGARDKIPKDQKTRDQGARATFFATGVCLPALGLAIADQVLAIKESDLQSVFSLPLEQNNTFWSKIRAWKTLSGILCGLPIADQVSKNEIGASEACFPFHLIKRTLSRARCELERPRLTFPVAFLGLPIAD